MKCCLFGNKAALTVAQSAVPSRRKTRVDGELCSCGNHADNQVCNFPVELHVYIGSLAPAHPSVILKLGGFVCYTKNATDGD